MKNKTVLILIVITLVFGAFAAGFYTGRNTNRAPVQISTLPQTTPPASNPSQPGTEVPAQKININKATVEELERLPKIGPKLAKSIVDYRNANGHFRSIEELTNVEGIGSGILEAIRDLITI